MCNAVLSFVDLDRAACRRTAEHQYVKYSSRPHLTLATAVRPCKGVNATEGNRLNWAALQNKLDFAHLHGYDIWVHGEQVRVSIRSRHLAIAQAAYSSPFGEAVLLIEHM